MESRAIEALGGVTDALAGAAPWNAALEGIARVFGGVGVTVERSMRDQTRSDIRIATAYFTEQTLDGYDAAYVSRALRPEAMLDPGQPIVQYDYMVGSERDFDASPFYAEFLARHRLRYYLGLRLDQGAGHVDVMTIQRERAKGHVSEHDVDLMQRLAPYLANALIASMMAVDLADPIVGDDDKAVVGLDRNAGPIWFSSAAQRFLRAGPDLDWAKVAADGLQGRLTWLPHHRCAARLIDITAFAGLHAPLGPDAAYLVELLPVAETTISRLTARYGLTPAEQRVLSHLIDGMEPAEIADELRVSMTTIRTHLARLRDKFEVSRTVDVIRLAVGAGVDAP